MSAYSKFVSEYLAAYRHQGGVKAVAMGALDAAWFADIQKEVSWILSGQASSNVGDKNHTTNWTRPQGEARQYSLYNATGKSDEFLSDFAPPSKVPKQLTFPHLKAIARFAELMGPSLINLRLNGLGAGSRLSLHEEAPISVTPTGRTYNLRFHLPIVTNPQANMLLDGEQFHFGAGTLYFFHHGCVHAAVNNDEAKRYHFVLDCELTPDLFRRLFPTKEKRNLGGYHRFSIPESDRLSQGKPIPFGEFVTEDGRELNELDYGRKVPSRLGWYQINYPSVFSPLNRLLNFAASRQ